jgi:uncharacterized protein
MRFNKTRYGAWAVITGASDGIGLAIARLLASYGIYLVLVARRKDRLTEISAQLTDQHGIQTRVIAADLTRRQAVKEVLNGSRELDVGLLINAAGFGTSGELIHADLEEEVGMIDVNCRAGLELTQAFARRFVREKRGGIVLFSSLLAFQGVPRAAHYAATKAYIQTLGEGLRLELAPLGVDVLVIAPGPVISGFGKRANMNISFGARPEDIAMGTLLALGYTTTVRPGLVSKLLEYSLRTAITRWGRSLILKQIMHNMTKHQKQPDAKTIS